MPSGTADYPFSSCFPAFTAINRRRRVTCKKCDLPVGYVDIGQAHLEAMRCQEMQNDGISQTNSPVGSVTIPSPINVSLNPKRIGSCQVPGSENPHMTWIIEDNDGKTLKADEIICDGCGSVLGARMTAVEQLLPATAGKGLKPAENPEEKSPWCNFSLERIKVEPLFGSIGIRESFSTYYGGERHFDEVQAIEDSAELSNNSQFWMNPHSRVSCTNDQLENDTRNTWPLLMIDLVRANELPKGTLGNLDMMESSVLDNAGAFTRPHPGIGIADVSKSYPEECVEAGTEPERQRVI